MGKNRIYIVSESAMRAYYRISLDDSVHTVALLVKRRLFAINCPEWSRKVEEDISRAIELFCFDELTNHKCLGFLLETDNPRFYRDVRARARALVRFPIEKCSI